MESENTPKVCIFTNFTDCDFAYSLTRVTEDQIKMFNRNGYKVRVIVAESFIPEGEFKNCELARIPNVPCHNEVKTDPTFDQDIKSIKDSLKSALEGIKTCITQDIVYKPSELKHQLALRALLAEGGPEKDITYLHWINSATPPITLGNLMGIFTDEYIKVFEKPIPNSYYVFFNDISKEIIAKNFSTTVDKVRVVHHPSDLDSVYGVTDKNLSSFLRKRNVYEADAICIYPIRLDRGKQVEYPIKTMAKLKELGLDVRMIVVDFHSTGGDKVVYREDLKKIGIEYGLNAKELAFTSEFCEDWRVEVPHDVVTALFRISNVFVMSSVSESYSLITQEAALTGNIIVLNQDFPPFQDIFGTDAIFAKYSSNWIVSDGYDEAMRDGEQTTTKYNDEHAYHMKTAGKILDRLNNDIGFAMQRKIRKERGLDVIFKKELEPLLYI